VSDVQHHDVAAHHALLRRHGDEPLPGRLRYHPGQRHRAGDDPAGCVAAARRGGAPPAEGTTYRAINTVTLTTGSAGATTTANATTWVNKFNYLQDTTNPASDWGLKLQLPILPEGTEIEIFNATGYAVTVAASLAGTLGAKPLIAGTLKGTGTKIAVNGAAIVKQITSSSLADNASPVAVLIGALS
jgi:hypothetical protein